MKWHVNNANTAQKYKGISVYRPFIFTISKTLGHASVKITMDIYTNVSEKFKQYSIQAIQDSIYLG